MDNTGSTRILAPVRHIISGGSQVLGPIPCGYDTVLHATSETQDDLLAAITQNVKYLIRLGFFAQDWARSPSESVFGRTKERRHC